MLFNVPIKSNLVFLYEKACTIKCHQGASMWCHLGKNVVLLVCKGCFTAGHFLEYYFEMLMIHPALGGVS